MSKKKIIPPLLAAIDQLTFREQVGWGNLINPATSLQRILPFLKFPVK